MAFSSAAPKSGASVHHSIRTAILGGAEQLLRIPHITTLTTTGSGADMAITASSLPSKPRTSMARTSSRSTDSSESTYPQWFSAFLADRAVRKPSPHTTKAYRQDFVAIATLLAADRPQMDQLTPADITKDAMRAAFGTFAQTHEPATIRRCWSTWNTLCSFLQTSELLQSNPMPLVGRPKLPKPLPKGFGAETVAGLLAAIDSDGGSRRRSDWPERDRALVLTGVLAGLRADEIIGANVGDIRLTEDGGVIHVRGKGNKDRRIPVEQSLLEVLKRYLDSRSARFPGKTEGRTANTLVAAWPATAALFVGVRFHSTWDVFI
jgi:site-specific recombinase XerC